MRDTIHVLGIVGSPRKQGNTDILVDEILDCATQHGAETSKVFLSDLHIEPCRGCSSCERHGKCVHDDNLEELKGHMKDAPVWILGSPVYYWGVTAQFKVFMDRWYGIGREVFEDKRVIIVMPLGASSPHYARHALGMLKDSCEYMSLKVENAVLAPGVFEKGEVRNRPDLMELARAAGKNLFNQIP